MSNRLTNPITVAYDKGDGDTSALCFRKGRILQATLFGDAADFVHATMQREAEYRSIFRRCVEIIGFHNGGDDEKLEAIRRTMLQAPHLKDKDNG